MRSPRLLVPLYASIHFRLSFAIPAFSPSLSRSLLQRQNPEDPALSTWIKNFAALGDSYAAGIGAGNVLGGDGDAACSRYDAAYPNVMQGVAFNGEPKFTNIACSGDKSENVMDQVKKLEDGSQDLITLSAGGNDVLLSDVLKACVFLPSNEDQCNAKLDETKKAIDNDLQGNVDDLLQALAPKLTPGGPVVYTLYAQFFNADTDACSDQTWNWFRDIIPGGSGVKLTKELRKRLNDLVQEANTKIRGAIASQGGSTRPSNIKILTVDWDKAVGEENGRFCEEGSKDDPADPSNAGLMFQRLNTGNVFIPPERKQVLETRDLDEHSVISVRNANEEHELQKRIPDDIARVFHPTVLGHQLIASHALMAILTSRGKDFKGEPAACAFRPPPPSKNPTPECDMDNASGLPANVFRPNTYTKFCEAVEKDPKKELNWIVGVDGNEIPRLRSKRSPPPNPDAYNDYKIALSWNGGDDSCGKGCKDAFDTMAQGQCGRTAGKQNIMACNTKSGSNCGGGTFEYSITPGAGSDATCKPADEKKPTDEKKPDKPQPGPRVCRDYVEEDIDKCGFTSIDAGALDDALKAFRIGQPSTRDVKTMQNYTQVYGRNQNPTYMLNIGYIPDCTDFDTMVVDNPQGKSGDTAEQSISYTDIIRDTYKECKGNKGLGGYQDYGCLRYGFYPTKIKGVFSDTTPKHYDYFWNAKNQWCGD